MRKSGKLLLGVLSVAALIGTGMGAFVINGTYGSDTDTIGVTTTEEYYSRGFNITAEKAADDGINFDGTGGDLLVTYTVKAKAIDGGFTQDALYNPKTWNAVAKEHRPNLKISATHTNVDETREDFFNKYVVLPDVATISYETWLAANLKETGYTYEFEVEWNKEALGGHSTPNEYFATVDNAKGKEVYNEIKSGLEYAKITVTFEAGYYEGGSTVDPTPSVETTGAVTLPDATSNALLSITGTQEDGTIEAGEQTLSLTLEEGYELDTAGLTVAVDDADPVKIDMDEEPTQVMSLNNPGKKYTGTYTFVAGSKYRFAVATREIAPEVKYATIAKEDVANATINVTPGQVETGTEVKFTVTPEADYVLKEVYYTVDNSKTTLTATAGEYSFIASEEKTYTIGATVELQLTYTKISAIWDTADNEVVTTRGVFMGMDDLYSRTDTPNYGSFFIADGDSAIEGYRVTASLVPEELKVGDIVEVTGTVGSCQVLKQLTNVTAIRIIGEDSTVTTPIVTELSASNYTYSIEDNFDMKVFIKDATFVSFDDERDIITFNFGEGTTEYKLRAPYTGSNDVYNRASEMVAGTKFSTYAFAYNDCASKTNTAVFYAPLEFIVPIESVSFGTTISEMYVGQNITLTSSVLPKGANDDVEYSIIEGEACATLEGVSLIGKAAGYVKVRVTSVEDTSKYSEMTIEVKENDTGTEILTNYSYSSTELTTEDSDGNKWSTAYKGYTVTVGNAVVRTNVGSYNSSKDGYGGIINPIILGTNNKDVATKNADTSILESADYINDEMLAGYNSSEEASYATAADLKAENCIFVLSVKFDSPVKVKDVHYPIGTVCESTLNYGYLTYSTEAGYYYLASSFTPKASSDASNLDEVSYTFTEPTEITEFNMVIISNGTTNSSRRLTIKNIEFNRQ